MVIAPHPDDEALAAAGLIQRVLAGGGQVRVVLMTSGDGFPEGVETLDGVSTPTTAEYRNYGKEREQETVAAMKMLGVERSRISFLGFPDGGLCLLASRYLSANGRAFESWYTDRTRPPTSDLTAPGVRYRGADVRAEIERLLVEFAPTVVVVVHPEDQHPDHCSTYIFVQEALDALSRRQPSLSPRVLHYLVHFGQWPLSADAGTGVRLEPPATFPPDDGRWTMLLLTPAEVAAKKGALLAYSSQMMVIGRFLLAFGREDELFLEGRPALAPECWCDSEHVATEVPPGSRRRKSKAPQ